MTGRSGLWLAALGAAACVIAGACGAAGSVPTAAPSVATPTVIPDGAVIGAHVAPNSQTSPLCSNGVRVTASLAPQGPLPAPGQMPAGSYMQTIQKRGFLRAGVDQNSLLWGYRDPATGQLKGFDIDMVDQVAAAIFGPDWAQGHIRYQVVPNAQRMDAVESGSVDLVAETMTINCEREKAVDFSTEYYDAGQAILVPNGSPIRSAADLSGQRVCASAKSTSLANLARIVPTAVLVSVQNQTDCLVMLQQGQVDAISTDDTILQGLAKQDPTVHLVANGNGLLRLSDEPYGMAISKAHRDFTRFVNGVLDQERTDGTWAAIWNTWLQPVVHTARPLPPKAFYRG